LSINKNPEDRVCSVGQIWPALEVSYKSRRASVKFYSDK